MMSYDRFFEWYPRYQCERSNRVVKELYNFMSQPEMIEKMLIANDDYGKPALAGIVDEVESRFYDEELFNLNDNFLRQLVGSMVREIIADFGYKVGKQKTLTGTKYFKSATHYQKMDEATLKLVKVTTIVPVA